jgi:competence protein ComEC
MPSEGLAAVAAGGFWLCLWRGHWRFVGLLPIVIGCATMLLVRPPDVLIAAEGGLFAVRGGDGELVFPPDQKGQAFLRDVWRRRAAGSALDDGDNSTLQCDSLGCVYRSRGRVVAFIRDTAALAEDCRLADAVITWRAIWPERCSGPQILIDRRSLTVGGGHALWLTRDGPIRIEAVRERRGDRPWSHGR